MEKRTTVVIDEALLGEARQALGTTSTRATIEVALREAARAHRLRNFADLVASGNAFDFASEPIDRDRQWRR